MEDLSENLYHEPIHRTPRLPCLFLFDTSGSMGEPSRVNGTTVLPIHEVNTQFDAMVQKLKEDSLARASIELAIITFGGTPKTVQNWISLENFHPPTFSASGGTPLAEALIKGFSLIKDRLDWYTKNDLLRKRPWVIILTDGKPDREGFDQAASTLKIAQDNKQLVIFACTTDPSPEIVSNLRKITDRVLNLKDLDYKEFFEWLTVSLKSLSHSQIGEKFNAPKPKNPDKLSPFDDVG